MKLWPNTLHSATEVYASLGIRKMEHEIEPSYPNYLMTLWFCKYNEVMISALKSIFIVNDISKRLKRFAMNKHNQWLEGIGRKPNIPLPSLRLFIQMSKILNRKSACKWLSLHHKMHCLGWVDLVSLAKKINNRKK